MTYNMKGTIKINLGAGFTADGENKEQAIEQIIERIIAHGVLDEHLDMSELTIKAIKKTFKVSVTQTFTNVVEISTDDYPDIIDETDARRYVENNLDEFTDDFDYSEYSQDDIDTTCYCSDTVEKEYDL